MKISPKVTNIIIKGVGAAAIALIAKDAHVIGKLQSDVYAQSRDADAMHKRYSNTRTLNSPSVTTAKLKNTIFRFEMEDNTRGFINSALGYFKGLGTMLVSSVVPFALGLGALLGKKCGGLAKGSAIGLGVYAGLKFFKDGLGLGNYNNLNSRF